MCSRAKPDTALIAKWERETAIPNDSGTRFNRFRPRAYFRLPSNVPWKSR